MKSFLDQELDVLNSGLLEMGLLIERSIESAVISFCNKDIAAANETIKRENDIEVKGKEIESFTVTLLLRYQPVASDLRKISAALRMINDMERIGNQASEISSLVIHLCDKNEDYILDNLIKMADKAKEMVKKSIDAFVHQDIHLARMVISSDNDVDELFLHIRSDIVSLIHSQPDKGEAELDLMMISKYLEKIGDHAVSIARWVIYSITGVKEDK